MCMSQNGVLPKPFIYSEFVDQCKVYNGPKGVDKIIGSRITSDGKNEYYIKFSETSYLHCEWMSENWVTRMNQRKLQNFLKSNTEEDATDIASRIRPQWTKIDRIIATQ